MHEIWTEAEQNRIDDDDDDKRKTKNILYIN